MNRDHTNLLTVSVQIVDSLASCIGSRTHQDDHAVSILSSVVREEVILTTGDLRELAKILLNNLGNCIVVGVAGLTVCEEGLGVLGRAACDGALGAHGAVAEALYVLLLDERTDVLLIHKLDLMILVRGAEAVEEVDEGHARLQRSEVRHGGEVHDLLHAAFAQHGETGLTAGHHVLVIAKDAQGMRGQRAGADVEHAGDELACNLVHVGDHEQQTLRRGECGGEGTGLQRAVHGTGSASLRLHLLHADGLTPEVLAATGSPLIDMLGHGRAGSDGIDGSHLREHVTDMRGSLVAITSDKFLFFSHK